VGIRRGRSVIVTFALVAACGGAGGSYVTDGNRDGGGPGGGVAGSVTIGSGIQYVSGHNGSMNPAVDTIVAGATVTWTWTGGLPHGVRSVGTPSFASSPAHTGSGTYKVEGDKVTIGPMAMTMMACPPGSLDMQFKQGLGVTNTYKVVLDHMIFVGPDGSSMLFARATSTSASQ